MSYIDKEKHFEQINFLKSSHTVQFTTQVDQDTEGVVDGVLPAGTIVPKNDATAVGITVNAVNINHGPQEVGYIVEGHILKDRLPVAPTDAAITALKNITFWEADGTPTPAPTPVG